jgi:hypothetical protein
MDASEFRIFLYGIFGESSKRQEQIVRQWHSPFSGVTADETRMADVFQRFVIDLLYEPVAFRVQNHALYFFARGSTAFAIPYTWLNKWERRFISQRIMAQDTTLFKDVRRYANNEFTMQSFCLDGNPQAFDRQWAKQLVRAFSWVIVREWPHLCDEFTIMLQRLLYLDKRARHDTFIYHLHQGFQNQCNVFEVCCDLN